MTSNIKYVAGFTPLFLMFWISGCSTLSNNPTDATLIDSLSTVCAKSIEEQLAEIITPLYVQGLIGGTSIAVQYNNEPARFYNFGHADKENNKPVDQHTLFAIGSVSKGFAAEYISLLARRNQLKWNTPFYLLSSDFAKVSDDAKTITLEELASHTSGFPRQINNLGMLSDLVAYSHTGKQFYRELDGGFFINWLGDFSKGKERTITYSNLAYAVLDKAVQDYLNIPLSKGIKASFIDPLGLMETTYEPHAIASRNLKAIGYAGDQPKFIQRGAPVPDWLYSGHMLSTAGLWSTSSDLIKYASYHYNLDRLSNDIGDALKDALTVRYKPSTGDGVAVGWLLHHNPEHNIYYQSGFISGFSSYIGIDPDHKTSIVVLQNQFNWTNNIGYKLLTRLADKSKYGCDMSKTHKVSPNS